MRERPRIRVVEVMECAIAGTRRHLDQIASRADLSRLDLTVVVSARREPAVREDMERWRARGVGVVEIPMEREIRPRADAAHLLALRRLLRAGRPDVLHTHSSKAGVLGRTAAGFGAGRPAIVHTPHTFAFAFESEFSPSKRRAFLAIERRLGRRTDALVAVSPSEARQAEELRILPAERVRVIENGLDPEVFEGLPSRAEARARWGIRPGEILVATAGLLTPAKGQADLLEAAARLLPRFAGLVVVVAGRGELLEALQAKVRALGLGERARFPGYTLDVKGLLRAADVFALPSRWEGMPYVLLEAMAAGTPVVASAVHGSQDLLRDGETGRLVPPGDPAALAAAIGDLLADPARARGLAERALAFARARPDVRAMVALLEALYAEVAAARRARRA